jgi:prepilin signal peptidase PulO-like enzyme (type II secretory pathway)
MLFWPSLFTCLVLFFGAILLLWLSAIDLKLRLLPDELTIALTLTGILFRYVAWPWCGPWFDALLGAVAGAGALGLVRGVANRIYGFETMGLGDVKLMGAAGLWLGLEGAIMALCVGAFAGLFHGLIVLAMAKAKNKNETLREMTIPAGPGFCAGIAIVAVIRFHETLPLFGLHL